MNIREDSIYIHLYPGGLPNGMGGFDTPILSSRVNT